MGASGITDSCQRCGLRRREAAQTKRARLYHPNYQSSTSVLAVPWTSVLAVPWTRMTHTSPGPCMPIVRDISISAVRDGPVTTTAALDWRTVDNVIASASEGRIVEAHNTAIWICGSREACNG